MRGKAPQQSGDLAAISWAIAVLTADCLIECRGNVKHAGSWVTTTSSRASRKNL
jgi:hypothetical protein